MRIGLAQINSTVGDLAGNAERIRDYAARARRESAGVILFPELALSGYPPEDLVLKPHFIEDCWAHLQALREALPADAVTVVGAPQSVDGAVHNSAVVFHGGRIEAVYHKMVLPNYGVFDEKRVFAAGRMPLILQLGDVRLAVHVCEDSWFLQEDAVQLLHEARVGCLLNISASPYHRGKRHLREQVLQQATRYLNCNMAYCNMVGGQDELVFDGGSLLLATDGTVLGRAEQFTETLWVADMPIPAGDYLLEDPSVPTTRRIVHLSTAVRAHATKAEHPPTCAPLLADLAEVYAALQTGLRDYVNKNGFHQTVVALSGGIDSALVAVVAVDTLGADRVAAVTMPSCYSSSGTRQDAEVLARNLGVTFHTVPIHDIYEGYLAGLAPLWPGRDPDITEENLQARIRGTLIMALSNKFGWLVLATGNKSELATGYCTLYGDMVGGFALIKDVPKTLVYALARWRNEWEDGPIIPPSTLTRPPSAELRPDQQDSDSLPPYDVLDAIVERYVERDEGVDRIVSAGFDPATVHRVSRLIDGSEYKRRQGAPGGKITPKAFGRDRRMPITNAYRDRVKGVPPV